MVWSKMRFLASEADSTVTVEHACVVCGEVLEAAGAGLTLATGTGLPEPVFATDARSRELEELQFGSEATLRWPMFAPEAIDSGVKSIIAVPIQVGAITLGAVGCYREFAGLPFEGGPGEGSRLRGGGHHPRLGRYR
ncbi:hypothetical protein [Amycolatopsis sp. w19]|uniref:hypothetical protein n=1 Tax=Amycolatopsis sp. w19 TaxID=3448134 RepID=UPI003F1DB4AF